MTSQPSTPPSPGRVIVRRRVEIALDLGAGPERRDRRGMRVTENPHQNCHSGAPHSGEPGTHKHRPLEYGFRACRFAASRNDQFGWLPAADKSSLQGAGDFLDLEALDHIALLDVLVI